MGKNGGKTIELKFTIYTVVSVSHVENDRVRTHALSMIV